MRELWGRGSGGRAMRSQRIGQGFESPRLHQNGHRKMSVFFCCKSLISPKSLDDAPRGLAGVFRLPALPCGEPPAPSGLTRRRTFVLSLKYLMSFPPPPRRSMFALAAGANNRPLAPRPQLLLFASQKYGLSPCSSFAALSHGSLIFAPRSQRSCVFFVLSLLCLMSFPPPRLRHSSPTRNRVHSSAKCANSLFPP